MKFIIFQLLFLLTHFIYGQTGVDLERELKVQCPNNFEYFNRQGVIIEMPFSQEYWVHIDAGSDHLRITQFFKNFYKTNEFKVDLSVRNIDVTRKPVFLEDGTLVYDIYIKCPNCISAADFKLSWENDECYDSKRIARVKDLETSKEFIQAVESFISCVSEFKAK